MKHWPVIRGDVGLLFDRMKLQALPFDRSGKISALLAMMKNVMSGVMKAN